jgi:dimethylaniline monooxygenase (N-oxide forming)
MASIERPPTVIIIGAGWAGLAAARAYLALRPDANLHIIDGDSTVGGVWSASRVHPGLIADSPAPLMEFSDFPMAEAKGLGLEDWKAIPSSAMHQYIHLWAKKHDLLKRCIFRTWVTSIHRLPESRWDLSVCREDGSSERFECDKLIIAAGLFSKPYTPELDLSEYTGSMFHTKNLGTEVESVLKSKAKHVTVIGGHRSAADAVYVFAKSGKIVDWIIRPDGSGPCFLLSGGPATVRTAKLKQSRASLILSPDPYEKPTMISWFMFATAIGQQLVKKIFQTIGDDVLKRYGNSENSRLLEPKSKE